MTSKVYVGVKVNKVNVGINGFGRIGRQVLRAMLTRHGDTLNVAAVSDLMGIQDRKYLLQHDTVYGRFPATVIVDGENLVIDGSPVYQTTPSVVDWKSIGVDIVVDSSGQVSRSLQRHIFRGASKVIVTVPYSDADATLVYGVNHHKYSEEHRIISAASCTTTCAATVLKMLDESFGVTYASLVSLNAYTTSQRLIDSWHNTERRRGRAAAHNIIPTPSSTTKSIVEVLGHSFGKERLSALAFRVPVICGSVCRIEARVAKSVRAPDVVNDAIRDASVKEYKGMIEYVEDELVSSDIIGNSHSAVIDSLLTQCGIGNTISVVAWYDNEYGYACRVADLVDYIARKTHEHA